MRRRSWMKRNRRRRGSRGRMGLLFHFPILPKLPNVHMRSSIILFKNFYSDTFIKEFDKQIQ